MGVSRSVLLFCVYLLLGLSLTLPAPDVYETAYDESGALPFEATPRVFVVTPPARGSPTLLARKLRDRQSPAPARARRIDTPKLQADGSTGRRVTLASLCALRF